MRLLLIIITGCTLGSGTEAAVDYEKDVRPILSTHCTDCHGAETSKNGLRLDTVLGILRGSDSGEPVFLKGSSDDSLIIHRVTSADPQHRMPPKGDRVPADQVNVLRAWIHEGGKMPGDTEAAESLKLKTDHWSFQPIKRPPVRRSGHAWPQNEVDEFLLVKLAEKGLAPSALADPRTLIRRLSLVMHGLTPTPEEVEAFVSSSDQPGAYASLVDKVLASPRYGERWARHWMDVVRYADTNGFETNRERKTAYHYRDWAIAAFNADTPYDVFIRQQIAGDALSADAATGFLVAGTHDIVKSPDMNLTLMQRQDELADMVNTTSTAFLGLTMGCARCHNHKFDPILQRDYFAMQAVFAGVHHGERTLRKPQDEASTARLALLRQEEAAKQGQITALRDKAAQAEGLATSQQRPPVNARENVEIFAPVETTSVRFRIEKSTGPQPCLDELEIYDASGRNVALASAGAKATASGTLPGYAIHRLEHIHDGLVGNDHSWISDTATGWVQISFPAKLRIQRIVWGRDRTGQFADRVAIGYRIDAATEPDQWTPLASSDDRQPYQGKEKPDAYMARLSAEDAATAKRLTAELAALQPRIAEASGSISAYIGTFSPPPKTHRLYRGEPTQKREVVAPDALTVLGTLDMSVDEPEQQRRLKFAHWMTSPHNPLTARVMVNRLWHYIFGTGIVATPSDFGINGARPTHPELLDWLADEFVKSGWSVKHIQRLILLSAAFRQSSQPLASAIKVDADGHFLWRFTPRRLEAEAIRDNTLAVSGALDLTMGGPGFYLMDVVEENVMHYFAKEKFTPAEFRRMAYQFRIRQTTDSVFSSFDCPDGGQVMPKRSRSTTPLQALNLFNSSFVLQQCDLLAARLQKEAGPSPLAQTDRAFTLFYGRAPDAWELDQSTALISSEGLPAFCRALYNSSEFLFVF